MAKNNPKNYRKVGNKFQVSVRQQGKAIYKTFADEDEAKQFVLDLKKSIKHIQANPADRSLRNIMYQYLRNHETQDLKSVKQIESKIDTICKDYSKLASTSINNIVYADLDNFKAQLKQRIVYIKRDDDGNIVSQRKLATNTINQYLTILNQTYIYAIKVLKLPIINIANQISMDKPNNKRDRLMSTAEYSEINKYLPEWMKNIVEFALQTCARQGEILKLTWADINFETRVATLRDTKNNTDRKIPLNKACIEILNNLLKKIDIKNYKSLRVFEGTTNSVSSAWIYSCKKANVSDLRFHDLRHTAITNLVKKFRDKGRAINLLTLQKITGHKTLSQLQRYYDEQVEDLVEFMD